MLLIESLAGYGKSSLLAEVVATAQRSGVRTGVGRADAAGQTVAFAAILEALFAGPSPLLSGGLGELPASAEVRFWLLQELEALLERAALDAPLLICLDDLQWADASTLAALRTLPGRLASLPIAWVCAFRSGEASPDLRATATRLIDGGAVRLVLPPLDAGAVAAVVADVTSATPGAELLAVAARAKGNPFLVVDLVRGLLEEDAIDVSAGRAELTTDRLPARVRDSMRLRLDGMPAMTRHLTEAAAVLGRTFSFSELAAMFALTPAALLEPVDELLRADILVPDGDRLAFRHDLVREAVLDALPETTVRALRRHAVDVLLARGAAPLEVASALAASADPGDTEAVATLLAAMRALGTTDPGGAAALGRRALELSAPDDPLRTTLVGEVAMLLHAADQVEDGRVFAETALRELLAPEEEAAVLLTITGMLSLSADARAESGRAALALDGISESMRGRHLARRAFNLFAAGRISAAAAALAEARRSSLATSDATIRFTLDTLTAGLEYDARALRTRARGS